MGHRFRAWSRRESALLWARIVAAAAALVLVAGAGATAADKDRDERASADEAPASEAYEAAQRKESERQAHRDSDAGREERRKSRTRYRGQSDAEALATARTQFPQLIGEPPLQWPPLRSGQKIERYLNGTSALIREPGGERSVVESTLPLVGLTPDGDKRPIDLALEEVGTALAPKSSGAAVRIPKDSRGRIRLLDEDIGIALDGAAVGDASSNSGQVFYGNALTDTDFVVEPVPMGVEVSLVLRSPDSPTEPALAFSLPGGARLRLASPADDAPVGSAEVVKDNKRIALVGPAVAVDAQGEPVEVKYQLDGQRLVMKVDTSGEVAYPVMIDPTTYVRDENGQSTCPPGVTLPCSPQPAGYDWPGWFPWSSREQSAPCPYPAGQPFYQCKTNGALYVYGFANTTYGANDRAVWQKNARPGTYIFRFDAANMGMDVSNSQRFSGICQGYCTGWPSYGQWYSTDPNSWANQPYRYVAWHGERGRYEYYCINSSHGQDCTPQQPANDPNAINNAVVFGLIMSGNTGSAQPHASMGGAATYSSDNKAPATTVTHSSAPQAYWVESHTNTVTVKGVDNENANQGMGMGTVDVAPDGQPAKTTCTTNNAYDSCPTDWTAPAFDPHTSPEGSTTYTATATDIVGNSSTAPTWTVKADRSPPTSYTTDKGRWYKEGTHQIPATASDAHSGLRESALWIALVGDRFDRTTANGWGTAEQGGAWTVQEGPASDFSASPADGGRVNFPSGGGYRSASLDARQIKNAEVSARIKFAQPTTGAGQGSFAWLTTRRQANNSAYRIGFSATDDGRLMVFGRNPGGGTLFPDQNTGLSYSPNTYYRLRTVVAANATNTASTVGVKFWRDGDPEPVPWSIVTTDNAGPHTAGGAGVRVNGGSTSGQQVHFDDFRVIDRDATQFKANTNANGTNCNRDGCPTSMTHTYTFNTAGLAEGPVEVTSIASDAIYPESGVTANLHRKWDDWQVKIDRTPPTFESGPPQSAPHPATRPGQRYRFSADTIDNLSGVEAIDFYVNDTLTPPGASGDNCSVTGCDRNPGAKQLYWDVPSNYAGADANLKLIARDKAGNSSASYTWRVHVDDKKPSATVISGPLREARGKAVKGSSFGLHVEAQDVSPGSGVRQVKLFTGTAVNNLTERLASSAQNCPLNNCTQTWDPTFTPGPGDQTRTPQRIRVQVADQAANTSADPPELTGQVSRWRLNETSGNTEARDSKGSNHGTYKGGFTLEQQGALTSGDKAASFNGTSGQVDLGNAASVQLTTGTVEAWVKTSSGSGSSLRAVVTKGSAWGLFLYEGKLSAWDWGSMSLRNTGIDISDGRWHHVAMTFQSGVANGTTIYLDGTPRMTTQMTVSHQNTSLQIATNTDSQWLNGSVDEVGLYNRVLSSHEVAQLHSRDPDDWKLGSWRLSDTSTTAAADAAAGEQVVNTIFDANTRTWITAGGFLTTGAQLTREPDADSPDGTHVAHVVTPATPGTGVATDVSLNAGQRYRVRVRVKRLSGSGLRIAVGEVASPNAEYVIHAGATPAPNGYTEYSGFVTPARSGAHRLYVRVANNPAQATTFSISSATMKTDNGGTYSGTYTQNQSGAPKSDGDKAALFGGGFVDIANSEMFKLTRGTIEAWVKASNPGSGHRGIITKQWAYGLFLVNGVVETFDWGAGAMRSTGVNVADGNWHHVAMTFRSGVANGTVVYVDGTPRLTTTIAVANQNTGIQVGAGGGGIQTLNGTIDDAAVYGDVMSASEVSQLYGQTVHDWKVVFDDSAPTLDDPPDKPSANAWFKGSATFTTTFVARDRVSGVGSFRNLSPSAGGGPDTEQKWEDTTCSDAITQLCMLNPPQRVLVYSASTMPEGQNTVRAVARDAAGNEAERTWPVKVDKTLPTVGQKSGTLAGDGYIEPGPQTLDVDTADLKPGGGPSSGVELVEAFYDDADDPSDPRQLIGSVPGNCSATGCDQTRTAHFDWNYTGTPKRLNITVSVRDRAQNSYEAPSWVVEPDPVPPHLEVRGAARTPLATGENLELDGTDADSGIQRFVAWVDPGDDPSDPSDDPPESEREHIQTYTCPCEPREIDTWVMSDLPPGEHEILVKVYDAAGNFDEERWTTHVVTTLLNGDRDKLGLEHWFQYDDTSAGGNSNVYVNAETGNTIWHSVPIVNPGRGLSAAVNLTYNSHDRGGVLGDLLGRVPVLNADRAGLGNDEISELSYGEVGNGFSLGISGPTRLNEPLEGVMVGQVVDEAVDATQVDTGDLELALPGLVPPEAFNPLDVEIKMTDADGTRHTFTRTDNGWESPPGVNLRLRRHRAGGTFATPIEDKWMMTRPDGVTHYYDTHGFLTATQDRNDNRLEYDYEYYDALTGDVTSTIGTVAGQPAWDLCAGIASNAIQLGEMATVHPPGLPAVNVPVYCAKRVRQVVMPAGADLTGAARSNQAMKIDYVPNRSLISGNAPPYRMQYPSVIGGNAGRISKITDVAGDTYEFTYDDDGFLTQFVEAANDSADRRVTALEYENYEGDPVNQVRADRQLIAVREGSEETARRTVIRHAHPEDRGLDEQLVPRQACGVTKRVDEERTWDPQEREDQVCRSRRSNRETTYDYVEPTETTPREFVVTDVIRRVESETAQEPIVPAVTRHTLDGQGRPSVVEDPLGRETRLEWNEDENAISAVERAANNPNAIQRTEVDYDTEHDTGAMTAKRTFPNYPNQTPVHTTTFDYRFSSGTQHSQVPALAAGDTAGQYVADLTSLSGPRPGVGQSFTIEQRGGFYTGNVTERFDRPNHTGNVARTTYDAHGQILTEDDEVQGNGDTEYRDYDGTGQPETIEDSRGGVWSYDYDARGNVTSVSDPRANRAGVPADAFTTTLDYDAFDRLVSESTPKLSSRVDPETNAAVPAEEWFTTRTFDHDRNGNTVSATDGEGQTTTMVYTPTDQPARVTEPGQAGRTERTDYVYDDGDRLIARVDPAGTPADADAIADGHLEACAGGGQPPVLAQTTRYCLDEAGRKLAEVMTAPQAPGHPNDPTALIKAFAYDDRDNLVTVTDAARNRNKSIADAVADATGRDANEDGRPDTVPRYTYAYDRLDQRVDQFEHPTEETAPGQLADPLRTHFEYDAGGNRTRVYPPRAYAGDPNGAPDEAFRTETFYDHRNLEVALRTPAGCTATERREDGRVQAITSPRGTEGAPDNCSAGGPFVHHTTRYTYDTEGDMLSRSVPFAENQYGRPDLQFQGVQVLYERDEVGNAQRIRDPRGNWFRNRFYDSGELRFTERPSFFELEWSKDYATPDVGRSYTEAGGGADLELADGGPKLDEVEDISRNAQGSGEDPELPQSGGHGDFGKVDQQDPGDMLPDAGGTTITVDDEGRISRITDAANRFREVGYDGKGRVTRKTWPYEPGRDDAHIEHEYTYDVNGNLERFRNGRHLNTDFEYDGFDRRIEETTPGALRAPGDEFQTETTQLFYDANDNVTGRRMPLGDQALFAYAYDSLDQMTTETNPENERWQYAHDEHRNVVEARPPRWDEVPAGERDQFVATYQFDTSDRMARAATGFGSEFTMEYGYDADGNQTAIEMPGSADGPDENPVRRLKLTDHDGRGMPWRQTSSEVPAANGQAGDGPATEPGADPRTTLREYDANGNVRRIVAGQGVEPEDREAEVADNPNTTIADATWHATVREYDDDDQLTAVNLPWSREAATEGAGVNDPDGPEDPEFGGDERRFRQVFERDPADDPLRRVTGILEPHEAGDNTVARTDYEYFATGWIESQSEQKVVDPDDPTPEPSANVTYAYDEAGNQTRWTTQSALGDQNPDGRDIQRTFNDDDTLRSRVGIRPQTNGQGDIRRRHEYFYNRNRSLIRFDDRDSIRRAEGVHPDFGPPDEITRIERDLAERETAVNEEGGRDTTFAYDANGNVERRQTDGHIVAGENNGPDTYGGDERKTTTFEFDALDRESSMTVDPAEGADRTTTTTWWPSNDMRARTKSNGTVERRYLNPRGEIERKDRDPEQGDTRVQNYEYDVEGNRTQDERGTHVFNPRKQLFRWTRGARQEGKVDTRVTYTRNGGGDVTREVDTWQPEGTTTASTTDYTYRGERLISSRTERGTEAGEQVVDSTYFYDDFGSVTRIRHDHSGPGAGGEDPPDGPDAGLTCPGMPDDAENHTTRYCYDEFERMTLSRGEGVERPTRYVYDGLDRRNRRIVIENGDEQDHDYSYIGTSELLSRETDHRETRKQYDYDSNGRRLGQAVERTEDATPAYRAYSHDANGSVEGLENEDGETGNDTYTYDPYGEPDNVPPDGQEDEVDPGLSDNARENPFRFEGFYYDAGVKTYDMRARSYRPDVGRFLSQDRYESAAGDQLLQSDPLTQNRYAFAGGNPVNNVEFDGHKFNLVKYMQRFVRIMKWIKRVARKYEKLEVRRENARTNALQAAADGDEKRFYRNVAVYAETLQPSLNAQAKRLEAKLEKKEKALEKKPGFMEYAKTFFLPQDTVDWILVGAAPFTRGITYVGKLGRAGPKLAKLSRKARKIAKLDRGLDKLRLSIGRTLLRVGDNQSLARKFLACSQSFVAGTPIRMANGRSKPIEKVEVGDRVLSTDPRTGKSGGRRVTRLLRAEGFKDMTIVMVGGRAMVITDGHPVWVESEGRWIRADDLVAGDIVRDARGAAVEVDSVDDLKGDVQVYNFSVAGTRTYYAGEHPVLVHNSTCSATDKVRAVSFIAPRRGQAIAVPNGATGPLATKSPGMQWIGGSGGHGLHPRVANVRVMDQTKHHPRRVVYENANGQKVNPLTGQTISNDDPWAHLYW